MNIMRSYPLQKCLTSLITLGVCVTSFLPLHAQEVDVTQFPNRAYAGIKKSLSEQIGTSRGDVLTPDSSLYLINRDPFRAIARGRQLFQRKFSVEQGLGPRLRDEFGDIEAKEALAAGLADSCAGCHGRPRGSAGVGGNVFTRPDSRDAPHLFGLGVVEMLADEITADLRAQRDQALLQAEGSGKSVSLSLTSKNIHYGRLTAFPDGRVDISALEGIDPDLRVKPFFAEGSVFSIREFIVGALQVEMGLQSPDPDILAAHQGARVVTPSGMVLDGGLDPVEVPLVQSESEDGDGDGVTNEMDVALIDYLEFYLLNYFRPGTYQQTNSARLGRKLMEDIGCTTCHKPDFVLEHDRRVADVETTYDAEKGIFNHLFATATPQFVEVDDHSGHPTVKQPAGTAFTVRDIFTDFKRHDLGAYFAERNFDGSRSREFMTEPLWGVGSTEPYGHDGRSITLRDVILRHGGEAQHARDAFAALSEVRQEWIIEFLQSLILFGPPDTASNLDPGDPNHADFPQSAHGSINLQVLFNDPNDPE